MFNLKSFITLTIVTVSVTGCSMFNSSQQVSPYSADARSLSIYDTSGFAFDAQTAVKRAMNNSQAVCKKSAVQVVSDIPKSIEYTEDNQIKTVFVTDMTYRCIAQ